MIYSILTNGDSNELNIRYFINSKWMLKENVLVIICLTNINCNLHYYIKVYHVYTNDTPKTKYISTINLPHVCFSKHPKFTQISYSFIINHLSV